MKNIIKTDFKRALKGAKFPLAIILMFFVWEFNSKRFADSQDVLYLFVHVWGRSITPLLAMIVTSTVYVTSGKSFFEMQYSESRNQKVCYI